MNQNSAPWAVLATKAQAGLTSGQKKWVDAKQHQAQLQASMQRMTDLFEEYRQQETGEAARRWDSQARLNHRQFMAQLLRVQQHLSRELNMADLAVEQAAKAVAELELQLQKMNTLHDQQAQRQRKALAEQEQRGIDDLAIMRFGAKALY